MVDEVVNVNRSSGFPQGPILFIKCTVGRIFELDAVAIQVADNHFGYIELNLFFPLSVFERLLTVFDQVFDQFAFQLFGTAASNHLFRIAGAKVLVSRSIAMQNMLPTDELFGFTTG